MDIARDFLYGTYQNKPLKLLPQPKMESDGKIAVRQAFWVSVRDQVSWLAYVNVVGSDLDYQMPAWSYGNRLYRSLIVDQPEAEGKLHVLPGPYRNARGLIYRKFQHSWPLYRRHVLLTVRQMARNKVALGEVEQSILDREEELDPNWRLPYLRSAYWHTERPKVHWGSFDVEKFYPSLSLELVKRIVFARSLTARSIGRDLLERLAAFSIDVGGWKASDLSQMQISSNQGSCKFIPTGLSVAGFLANVAMLPVDDWAKGQVRRRQVAHFRYVDDHIVLAGRFSILEKWMNDYGDKLQELTGCHLKMEKTEPEGLRKYLSSSKGRESAVEATSLDTRFPKPFMTQILAKVSDLARLDFELLDHLNQERVLNDLQHLILTEFPHEELPEKTRISFAATLLARFTPRLQVADAELPNALLHENEVGREISRIRNLLGELRPNSMKYEQERQNLRKLKKELNRVLRLTDNLNETGAQRTQKRTKLTLSVLSEAIKSHPEKLRLWQRMLDYVRIAGEDPGRVFRLANYIGRKNPLGTALLYAKLKQIACAQVFITARQVLSQEAPPRTRELAADYLFRLNRLRLDDTSHRGAYYETEATRTLEIAFQAVGDLFRSKSCPGLPRNVQERLRRELSATSGHAKSILDGADLWWLGSQVGTLYESDLLPVSIQRFAERLRPRDITSWRIWDILRVRPPASAIRDLSRTPSMTTRADSGWVADIVFPLKRRDAMKLRKARNSEVRQVARLFAARRRSEILLAEWIDWTSASVRNQFDPRISEWTALEILRLVAARLGKIALDEQLSVASSVYNFVLPRDWTTLKGVPSWEEWRRILGGGGLGLRRRGVVHDGRVVPEQLTVSRSNLEFAVVRSLGVILLNLLRRDHRIPIRLVNTGFIGTVQRIAIRHIQDKPCSSRTMAILEALLMDRTAETLILTRRGLIDHGMHDDTARDVPVIGTIRELQREILHAEKILAGYQITVSAHEPRQLIPLYLGQYTRENWNLVDSFPGLAQEGVNAGE
ncbi:MAG TPA: RNA-directed DNA polymerase [Verrucomicrobiae bacterium]|nr:RNA-directed DNA polymerase [Verrucomicrobiae bacterium]